MINDSIAIAATTMDKTIFTLPKFLGELEHITTVDTGGLQFVICCDKLKLYIFPLLQGGNKSLGTIHQSLPIPNIKSLRTIAKNFLMIETDNKYLGIFQIIKSPIKQPTDKPVNSVQANTVKVQFSEVLKWRIFSSYFIREVMENLFEVQVFFTDLQFEIFHFTNKNKKGSMSFTISQNGRIIKSNKRQLYGSKFFFNIGRKLVYWMKNFSDKQFFLQQIVAQQPMGSMRLEPFGYFGVQRAQQYKLLSTNFVIRDCLNPAKRHSLQIEPESFLNDLKAELATLSPSTKKKNGGQQENPFHELVQRDGIAQILESYKVTIFTDLLMIENKQKKRMEIYQIRTEGSSIVGRQDSHVPQEKDDPSSMDLKRWQWYFGNSKKLIAIDRIGFKLKYVQQMTLREKHQQIFEETQITMPAQSKKEQQKSPESIQNQDKKEKKSLQKLSTSEKQNEINSLKGRKFSKDELKKFCQEFDENKSKQFINEELIQKVDQTNNRSSQKLSVQTQQENGSYNEVQDSKRKTQISVQKQEKKEEKIEPNTMKNSQDTKDVNKNQQQMKIKQKPPMKIIQKNKISVAKTFYSQQQSQSRQGSEMKINELKVEKVEKEQLISQKKSFNKQQKKESQIEVKKQSQEKKVKQGSSNKREQIKVKQPAEQKEEKKKVNVITRATLLKKKQIQASKELQNKTILQTEQPKTQQLVAQKQGKTINTEQVKPLMQEKKVQAALDNEEEKPKTRYIPSIDIRKASASQLNECEFLSEDSLSQDQQKGPQQQFKPQTKYKKSFQEDEQIEEQIEGESGYSSQTEEDMEHLIDDDIGKKDTTTNKEVTQTAKQEINHDEEIQKICNNLFEQRPSFSYKKASTHSPQTVAPKTTQLDRNISKEQMNEINQLNSLLFKTNIKRTNIFGSEEDKTQIVDVKKEQIKVQEQKAPSQNQTKQEDKQQEGKNVQVEKKTVEEKKSKVWNDLSSDSDDEQSSSENQTIQRHQITKVEIKKEQDLPSQQLEIAQTLEKLKKVESQCTKILSEIEDHKTKEIESKNLEQKIQQQTKPAENVTVKTEETKDFKSYNPLIQDSNQKIFTEIFGGQQCGLFPPNPYSSRTSAFPFSMTPNWLQNKPSTLMTQSKDQNFFINFKKSLQDSQNNHHNLFGLGQNRNKGEPSLFMKFLNEKQSKKQSFKEEQTNALQQPKAFQKQESKLAQNGSRLKLSKQIPSPDSESTIIPTTLLPKIQQLIASYEQSTLTLLQKQQSSIIKSLQEIPNTHNPYNKNHSLLLPEQIKEEIIKQTKNTVKKWLATKMLDKIQSSFKQIMQEHKKVYEDALRYYQNEAKRRITTMQLQYEQQQTILTDIENVAANLSSALQGSVLQGEQMHTFQLKEWRNEISNVQATLIQPLNQQIDDSKQFFTERNKNLQNLGNELSEIKEILKNKLKKKQELKQIEEKKKLKMQQKLKEQQEKKLKKGQQEGKKSNSKKVKVQPEISFAQYYNQSPHYGHYEPQFYGRPPYSYY